MIMSHILCTECFLGHEASLALANARIAEKPSDHWRRIQFSHDKWSIDGFWLADPEDMSELGLRQDTQEKCLTIMFIHGMITLVPINGQPSHSLLRCRIPSMSDSL